MSCRIAVLQMCLATTALASEAPRSYGLVGLRLLPHDAVQAREGGLGGIGNYADFEGQYTFVAEKLDVVWGPRGCFKTDKSFFEWYLEDDGGAEVNPDPKTSKLVEYILICRETGLIHRGKPGPFKQDYRILYPEDVAALRKLFREAHAAGLLKHDNYKLIQMVEHPCFFAEAPEAQKIVQSMDGVVYEAHQFNRHWPLETGWSRPEPVVRGAKWTLDQGKDYIFYYGPFLFRETGGYREFVERDWLYEFWKAGLPKRNPRMHYFLNAFPYGGCKRPVGPESEPHSNLGMTKWLIEEVRAEQHVGDGPTRPSTPTK